MNKDFSKSKMHPKRGFTQAFSFKCDPKREISGTKNTNRFDKIHKEYPFL